MSSLSPPTPVEGFFKRIASLLAKNPHDIITLHLECYPGKNGGQDLRPLLQTSGLDAYIGTINPNDPRLTLGQMRHSGKRLIIFSDNPADDDPLLPYRIFHTTNYRETLYDLGAFPECERRFDNRDHLNITSLLVMNHFYTSSYSSVKKDYSLINNYAEIMRRIQGCHKQEGIYPNFIALDFVEEGNMGGAREAVMAINMASVPAAPALSQSNESWVQEAIFYTGLSLGVGMCIFSDNPYPPLTATILSMEIGYGVLLFLGDYVQESVGSFLPYISQFLTLGLLWQNKLCGFKSSLVSQEYYDRGFRRGLAIGEERGFQQGIGYRELAGR